MLMDHADAAFNGILGTIEMHLFSLDEDLAAGRLIKSVQDIHQGTLAGAVLSQDGMHLSLVDGKVNTVVGRKITELFNNVFHFDDYGLLIHVTYTHRCIYLPLCLYLFKPAGPQGEGGRRLYCQVQNAKRRSLQIRSR